MDPIIALFLIIAASALGYLRGRDDERRAQFLKWRASRLAETAKANPLWRVEKHYAPQTETSTTEHVAEAMRKGGAGQK